jgi:hypothetical protein
MKAEGGRRKAEKQSGQLPVARCQFFLLLLLFFTAAGAGCPHLLQQYTQPLPRVLPVNATLEQVLEAVNTNAGLVNSFSSQRATISVPGAPPLRAKLAFERPRNFRLTGETGLTGPEVDLGSNDELFWFWVKRQPPPATYFCRHDQYATSAAKQIVPLPPEWFIQSLGVVSFRAEEQHEGPFPVHGGRLEIRSRSLEAGGPTRITILDDARGVVLEQHVYDARGQRLASVLMSGHARDAATGAVLPRHVEIRWPPTRFEMTIDLAEVQVNALDANAASLWVKPFFAGYPDVDLAKVAPAQLGAPAAAPAATAPPTTPTPLPQPSQ